MDPEDRRLLIEIHGDVKSIMPELRANSVAILNLDARVRSIEVRQGEQGVKVSRVENDIGGAWKRIKGMEDRAKVVAATENRKGRMIAFIEFFAALPSYVHALLTLGSLATTFIVIAMKMHGVH